MLKQNKLIKIKSAKNLRGTLISSFTKGTKPLFFLRVNDNSEEGYTDYRIFNFDIDITIDDDDAYIYKEGDEYIIDYSEETLGWIDVK